MESLHTMRRPTLQNQVRKNIHGTRRTQCEQRLESGFTNGFIGVTGQQEKRLESTGMPRIVPEGPGETNLELIIEGVDAPEDGRYREERELIFLSEKASNSFAPKLGITGFEYTHVVARMFRFDARIGFDRHECQASRDEPSKDKTFHASAPTIRVRARGPVEPQRRSKLKPEPWPIPAGAKRRG
jgi:hypothetical protein